MKQITFIIGLPGSGKSHYANNLSITRNALLFDDYKKNAIQNLPYFAFSRHFVNLITSLQNEKECIVADVDFCDPKSREEAQIFINELINDVLIKWVFFEKDIAQCEKNILQRVQLEVDRNITNELTVLKNYISKYIIPPNAQIIKVWREK